jgi:tetratricopeptide (TPR) repeat protein
LAKVFLSYSRKDATFVRELHRRLTRDGVDCFYDETSIEGGENFVLRLQDGVETCRFFVAMLSPDFVTSKWTAKEWTAAHTVEGCTIIPLLLRECKISAFFRTSQTFDVSTDEAFEANYPRICTLLGGNVVTVTVFTDRTTLPPVRPIPPKSYMPHASMRESFVGRVGELWRVHDQLQTHGTSVVSGVGVVYGAGGLGKTQLAIEYVHRFNGHYPGGVFWIDCEQGISRLIEVLDRALELGVDGKLPVRDQLASIWAAVAQRPTMLVVLDNFLEDVPVREWLPVAANVHVLVTTRRTDLRRFDGVRVPVMNADEGQRLLGEFSQDARALVQEVGGLPLALELLRVQLEELPAAEVLKAFRGGRAISMLERFAAEYREELPDGHATSIAATFQASWSKATEDGREVLLVMSHLAPAPVPFRLLRAVLEWEETDAVSDRLRRAVTDLARLSLVERDSEGQPTAHRLILGFLGSLPDAELFTAETFTAVDREMSRAGDDQDTASYRDLEAILPHADWVLVRVPQLEAVGISLAESLVLHHKVMGRFQLAKRYGEDALGRAVGLYPYGHPGITAAQSNLAAVLQQLGELEGSRDLVRKALTVAEQSFPSGHRHIATLQSNLAQVLADLGEREEARDLLRKVLWADERSYPAGHPQIAADQSNLATVLRELGEREEARQLLRDALAADERRFPAGHPTIAIRQSNLAAVLHDLGELQEAREVLRKALATDEQSFPEGHPYIATDQHLLAGVLRDLGEMEEARELAQKAYSATLSQFGPDHPKTRSVKAALDSLSASA